MSTTLTGTFETRREAEMAVERLVQQFEIERTDIFLATDNTENSVGSKPAGSDREAGLPSPDSRDDAELNGPVTVSVDVKDDTKADGVRSAFTEFDASEIAES